MTPLLEKSHSSKKRKVPKIALIISLIVVVASIGMIFRWSWFWYGWDIIGAVLVAYGCIGEWRLLYIGHTVDTKRSEKRYAIFVAVGVTMDIFGLIYGIPEAIKLEDRVEELRKTNADLQLMMQPRTISADQIKNFIFLTEKMPKFPIRMIITSASDESFSYAVAIQSMLNQAKYSIPNADTNFFCGIYARPAGILYRRIGETNDWHDVEICCALTHLDGDTEIAFEKTNGFKRPVILSINDTNRIVAGFVIIFKQIGIKAAWTSAPEWISQNPLGVYVRQKAH